MTELFIFENINPKEEIYPERLDWEFVNSEYISRGFVENLSIKEIAQVLIDIDIKSNETLHKNDVYDYKKSLEAPPREYATNAQVNYLLREYKLGTPINSITNVKSIGWPELFAVIARGQLAFALRDSLILENNNQHLSHEEIEVFLIDKLAFYAVTSAEAAAIGRTLALNDDKFKNLESTISTERKSIASSGGKAKSDKYRNLKTYVIDQYTSMHTNKTNSQAAMDIARNCPPELLADSDSVNQKKLITNPKARFATWIGEYKKSK